MSRKFFIACSIQVMSFFALFADKLDGGDFVMISVAVLGLYGYANIQARKAGEV